MANRPSALKRLRQSKKRHLQNQKTKSRLRTQENRFTRMLERGEIDAAQQELSRLTKLLQQAAARNVIHANKAARKQARLRKRLNRAAEQSPA